MTAVTERQEVPHTLEEPTPKPLGLLDQLGLWGNLGVSLLGFTGAYVVLQPFGPGTPKLSLVAALVATVVGTTLGSLAVAVAALPGATTGSPAMVLLRGVFGARLSYLPTAANVVQMLGWGTFELVTIATAARTVEPAVPRWIYVVVGGVITTGLAMRPLGAVRVLRKYVTAAVIVSLTYLFVQLLRHPIPAPTHGTWNGFWIGVDSTVAVAVSWVPMAADYARHSRRPRSATVGAFAGYGITQIACYGLGLIALSTVARSADDIFGAFIAVPLGGLAFTILAIRELDQSFANVYSTAVSTQNLRPAWDRRVLAVVIGTAITVAALAVDIYGYASFLSLLGSIFVPMFAVLAVDYFFGASRRGWDLSTTSPARWAMLVPWAVGFVIYQLVYPGDVSWWAGAWGHVQTWLHFPYRTWMSASIMSFLGAAVITVVITSGIGLGHGLSKAGTNRSTGQPTVPGRDDVRGMGQP